MKDGDEILDIEEEAMKKEEDVDMLFLKMLL